MAGIRLAGHYNYYISLLTFALSKYIKLQIFILIAVELHRALFLRVKYTFLCMPLAFRPSERFDHFSFFEYTISIVLFFVEIGYRIAFL